MPAKNWYQIEEIWKEEVVIREQIDKYENLKEGELVCLGMLIFSLAAALLTISPYLRSVHWPPMAILIILGVLCFALWRWFHRKANATMEFLVAAFEQEFGIRPPTQKTRATMKVTQQFVDARLKPLKASRDRVFKEEDEALQLRALIPADAEAALNRAGIFALAVRVAKEELEERVSLAKFFGFNTLVV